MELIRRAGYPVAIVNFGSGTELATYLQFIHYVLFGIGWLRRLNFASELESQRAETLAETGGEWKHFLQTDRQAKWRASLTLRWNRIGWPEAPVGKSAPETYAAVLKHYFANRAAEYADVHFFGDTRYAAQGKAIRAALDRGAEMVFRARLRVAADVHEGMGVKHSCRRGFSTVLLSEAGEDIRAAAHKPEYNRTQFLATQAALAERNLPVVSITLRNLDERAIAALDEFFAQTAKHLKE
jgi:hypothetical protein